MDGGSATTDSKYSSMELFKEKYRRFHLPKFFPRLLRYPSFSPAGWEVRPKNERRYPARLGFIDPPHRYEFAHDARASGAAVDGKLKIVLEHELRMLATQGGKLLFADRSWKESSCSMLSSREA